MIGPPEPDSDPRAPTVLLDVEVEGAVVDVSVEDGRIAAVGAALPRPPGATAVQGEGAALLPGLHDHHVHLLAMAAAESSVDLRPLADGAALDRVLRDAVAGPAPSSGWLRVVGYDERHGPLDRARLDALVPGRAVRVQHRSGAAWVLSTPALTELGLADSAPTGWVHRRDGELGPRWPREDPTAALAGVGARLAARGVTGVTDATPFVERGSLDLLAAARTGGDVPQQVMATGGPELASDSMPAGIERGPVKVVVADDALPPPDELVTAFRRARRAGRPVAVHCVTRVGLVLALAAWEELGVGEGDRIEHGAVIPIELVATIAEMGLRVVTQPAFVAERGDRYLAEVDLDDRPHLYRCTSLVRAGVPVAGSTDAPFGPEDVWVAIRAAIDRRSPSGAVVGPGERSSPADALALFLGPLDDPGGAPRRTVPGARADLCLLDAPLSVVLGDPRADRVRATWIAGVRVA